MQNPMAQIEEERKEHQAKMAKMEREMEEVFERKVREKRQKLSDSKADLEKRHKESREKLEQQKKELEDKMAAFEQEKASWERMNGKSQTQYHSTVDCEKILERGSLFFFATTWRSALGRPDLDLF